MAILHEKQRRKIQNNRRRSTKRILWRLQRRRRRKNTYDINIEEIVAQKNYKGQEIDNEGTIKIGNEGEKLENRRTTNKIEITKVDSQNKTTTPQGDASIEGTEYELYAKEKIYHADGKTSNYEEEEGLLYKEGDLVAEGRINKEGKLTFEGLESGKYYIKEKKQEKDT